MATTADVPRLEMLQVADMVAREKGIEREEVLEAMEQAIQKAGRAKYGLEHDIRAEIDRKTGEIKLLRYMQVADPIENENTQVALAEALINARFSLIAGAMADSGPAREICDGQVAELERLFRHEQYLSQLRVLQAEIRRYAGRLLSGPRALAGFGRVA